MEYVKIYRAQLNFNHNLVAIEGPNRTACFEGPGENGQPTRVETTFDMIHVCPPQTAPDFISKSPLADANGWVDVNQVTLQHARYSNVFGLGDVTSTPNAKTMAAARKQAPVVAENVIAQLDNKKPSRSTKGTAPVLSRWGVAKWYWRSSAMMANCCPRFPHG
jgi:sulfide:quinone oxidoreductase